MSLGALPHMLRLLAGHIGAHWCHRDVSGKRRSAHGDCAGLRVEPADGPASDVGELLVDPDSALSSASSSRCLPVAELAAPALCSTLLSLTKATGRLRLAHRINPVPLCGFRLAHVRPAVGHYTAVDG